LTDTSIKRARSGLDALHVGAGDYRSLMRGSIRGAARSAKRLPSTIANAATRVTPMMIGMSTRWIACQAS
jgi:hypothetical protein